MGFLLRRWACDGASIVVEGPTGDSIIWNINRLE